MFMALNAKNKVSLNSISKDLAARMKSFLSTQLLLCGMNSRNVFLKAIAPGIFQPQKALSSLTQNHTYVSHYFTQLKGV